MNKSTVNPTVEKAFSLALVVAGFAFLWLAKPTDGVETLAVVVVVIGALNLATQSVVTLIEHFLTSGLLNPTFAPSAPNSSNSSSAVQSGSSSLTGSEIVSGTDAHIGTVVR